MAPRDSQLSKVLGAETVVMAMTPNTLGPGDDVQAFALGITRTSYFRTKVGNAYRSPDQVAIGRYGGCQAALIGSPSRVVLHLPTGITTKLQVVHAIAHLVTPPDKTNPPHAVPWVKTMLEMTDKFLGPGVTAFLRDEYRKAKVKTKTMSPEAKEAARQRFLARQDAKLDEAAANLEFEMQATLARLKALE